MTKMKDYEWSRYKIGDYFHHALIPSSDVGKHRTNHANAIARIEPFLISVGRGYKTTLLANFNAGVGTWAIHGNVKVAKNWVANRAANSWWGPLNIK